MSIAIVDLTFQFHTGSIKRWGPISAWFTLTAWSAWQGFNSILVRLKGNQYDAAALTKSFNSILVRLKANRIQWDRLIELLSFNSILVRLKEHSYNKCMKPREVFQFHTGSIKRRSRWRPQFSAEFSSFNSILVRLKATSALMFQFHTGSIKRLLSGPTTMFQFHTGSIKSLESWCWWINWDCVSIPYWFD